MKEILLTEQPNWEQAEGRYFDLSSCSVIVNGNDDAAGLRPDGQLQFKILRKRIDPELETSARRVARFVASPGSAAGRKVASGFQKDETGSSVILGYFDRVRLPFCRPCAFNAEHPWILNRMAPYIQRVDEVYRTELPDIYAVQMEAVKKTQPCWMIPGTAFTTITMNRNWRTAAHRDDGNLPDSFGVMTCMSIGHAGGELIFPRFRCAIEWGNGDVLLGNLHELHCTAPILGMPGMYERLTCVFYFREGMVKCGTPEQELDRAKHLNAE